MSGEGGRVESEGDKRAEGWLRAQHGPDWHIGNATAAEWRNAYGTVDQDDATRTGRGVEP